MSLNAGQRARPRSLKYTVVAATGMVAICLSLVWGITAAQELADDRSQVRPDTQATIDEAEITAVDREHWSFRPLRRPAIPQLDEDTWSRGAIDRFILAKLREKQLAPMPEADRTTLIRRLTFDLTGLPPEPDEVDAFLADRSPGAYERLVDRLLASPAYGQRWAQHWLDLAQFAETDGFEHDLVRPDAWKYRDWVIGALNADLPYDRFIALQLAADQLAPDDASAQVATHFLLAGPDMPDINSQEERRNVQLNQAAATLGAVVLALQTGCAQCHDHKYDPISQADFYRLRAFFRNSLDLKHRLLAETSGKPSPSYLYVRGDWRRRGPQVEPAFLRIANPWGDEVAKSPGSGKRGSARTSLVRWLTRPDHPLTSRVIANRLWQHHFGRGLCETPSDFGLLGETSDHLELLDHLATQLIRDDWSLKALHRQMVTSATYRQASRPEADGLAALQRRDAQAQWQRNVEADPDNLLYSRAPRRRLEGEAIRDAMLAAGGRLNHHSGGPSVRPPIPREVADTLINKNHWQVSPEEADHYRRSVYVFARRNLRYPLFEAFDRPQANESCARRSRSTTAPQSLLLVNSELSLHAAQDLAGFVASGAGDDPSARIALLFRRALGRRPSDVELRQSQAFLVEQISQLAAGKRDAKSLALPSGYPPDADPAAGAALVDLALALLNVSEFVYVD